MKKLLLMMLGVLALGACTNERGPVLSITDNVLERYKGLKVYVVDTTLTTMDLIRKAALDSPQNQEVSTRTELGDRAIKEMIPINGENGEPLMYVFNYADDAGWAIVSGTTEYMPILAHGESGNFDMNAVEGRPVEMWLEQEKANIAHLDEAPDSIKEQYRVQWLKYAFKSVPITDVLPAMTRYDASDALAYQLACCEEWAAEGYDIYILDAFMNSNISCVSTTLRNQIISDAYTYGTDMYDGIGFNCLVLIRESGTTYVGPFVTTKWHQNSPYNDSIPNNYVVGCVPLAVAQIMRYHEYPTYFNWSNMPNSTSSHTAAAPIASFLKDVNVACNTTNGPSGSGSTIQKALTALHNYGYTSAEIDSTCDEAIIRNEIENHRPVFLRGQSGYWNAVGHAWVCSGIEKTVYGNGIVLKAMQPSLEFYTVNYSTSSLSYRYYMTWGWNDSNDGYYSFNTTWEHPCNYNVEKKAIINIKH